MKPTDDDDETISDDAHDPTGLDLASSIARVARGQERRKPRPKPQRKGVFFSGAGRDSRDPQPVGEALGALTRSEQWRAPMGIHMLLARWSEVVGPIVAEHSRPEAYEDHVITVRTSSTAWATQLRMMAPRLVAKLNEALGQGTVVRLRVLGPSAPSWKHGLRAVRDGRGPRDTYG